MNSQPWIIHLWFSDWFTEYYFWPCMEISLSLVNTMCEFCRLFIPSFHLDQPEIKNNQAEFNKIIAFALVGYEMIVTNSALRTSFVIYHHISNAGSWNNCQISQSCLPWSRSIEISVVFRTDGNLHSKIKIEKRLNQRH